jgi:hypothetical protein
MCAFEESYQIGIDAYTSLPATRIVSRSSPILCYMLGLSSFPTSFSQSIAKSRIWEATTAHGKPGCASTSLAIGPYGSMEARRKTKSRTGPRAETEMIDPHE